MNCDILAISAVLPLCDAKRLWAIISKPSREYFFYEGSCEGGSDVEIRKEGLSRAALGALAVPPKCFEFYIDAQMTSSALAADSLIKFLIGGLRGRLPAYGWRSRITFIMIPRDFRHPIAFSYKMDNTLKFLGRNFEFCHEVSVSYRAANRQDFSDVVPKEEPEESEIQTWISNLWKDRKLPTASSAGHLETHSISPTSRTSSFDPRASNWGWDDYEMLIRSLAGGAKGGVRVSSSAHPGAMNSPETLTKEVCGLIKDALATPFERFNISYNATMTMSWKDREKIRKKWKCPVLQELGRLEFKNGSDLEIKLVIQRDGYEFMVEATNVEAVKEFQKSKISKAVEWSWDA